MHLFALHFQNSFTRKNENIDIDQTKVIIIYSIGLFFWLPCNHLQYSESAPLVWCSPGWSEGTPRPFLIPSSLNFKSQTRILDGT